MFDRGACGTVFMYGWEVRAGDERGLGWSSLRKCPGIGMP